MESNAFSLRFELSGESFMSEIGYFFNQMELIGGGVAWYDLIDCPLVQMEQILACMTRSQAHCAPAG
jgi:hypothetical protein